MKTIFCLFRDFKDAQAGIEDLVSERFPKGEMNLIMQAQSAKNALDINPRAENIPVTGQQTESERVPILDTMLHGKQPVTLPGAGKIYTFGELANVMTRTASAVATGESVDGLQGALVDFGLPPKVAKEYYNGVRSGGLLFFLRTSDERSSEAASRLRNQDGNNLVSYTG